MTIDDYGSRFPAYCQSPVRVYACRYLEARGLRFSVDFGFSNAVRKATDMFLEELKTEEGYGAGV